MRESGTALRADNLYASYTGAPILTGVDLEVGKQEIVAVLGRNGAGKTTLMRALMGVLIPRSGRIDLRGKDVTKLPAYRRARLGIAYTPQGRMIFPRLTVLDNIRVGAVATGKKVDRVVSELLDAFPSLRPQVSKLGGSLSGGQQQLLAIARAMATEPQILLLDEPTEGVQPTIVDEIIERLQALNKGRGTAMIVVEQNLEFAAVVASRAYLMNKGVMVTSLSMAELVQDKALQHELMGV
jgi:urea ABC transporter ATP-binding protein UrtE